MCGEKIFIIDRKESIVRDLCGHSKQPWLQPWGREKRGRLPRAIDTYVRNRKKNRWKTSSVIKKNLE